MVCLRGALPFSNAFPLCVRVCVYTVAQPFAPFSKGDRVGRACEWNYTRDRERNRHWQRNAFGKEGEPSPFVMEQVDEEGFHLVEQKTPAKPKWGPGARGGRGGRGGMRCFSFFLLFVCRQRSAARL